MPPSVEPVTSHAEPSVFIDKKKAEPRVEAKYVFPFPDVAHPFDITGAVRTVGIDPQDLRYSWYYDFEIGTSRPLDSYLLCGASRERCNLYPCEHANAVPGSHHFLMVVVSDLPLPVTDDVNRGPFDFPAKTHFDSVKWDVFLNTSCP